MGNQNSGRRPNPTALTVLRGNPSRKKLNENEPRPRSQDIEKPDDLSPGASAAWDKTAPEVMAMRVMTSADVIALKNLCELQATLAMAVAEKSRDGFSVFLCSVVVDGAGNERPKVEEHPAIRLERNTVAAMRPYIDMFGLNPSSRSRLSVPATKEPESKWAGAI